MTARSATLTQSPSADQGHAGWQAELNAYPHLLALVAFSLLVGYGMVFASGFDPEHVDPSERGPFQQPVTETAVAYLLALAVSLGVLVPVQHLDASDPRSHIAVQTLVLGLPAMLGAARRLAL